MIIVDKNPLDNFKVLYATGHMQLDRKSGVFSQEPSINYTIKDGIVFDAKQLREQVKELVANQKEREVRR